MFRKLKDKLAEEMKSSPQRLQQFAIAAQAAVTSASSSISDISNNDLFSIADEDPPQKTATAQSSRTVPGFQDVSLGYATSPLHDSVQENGEKLPSLFDARRSAADALSAPGVYPPPARTRRLSNGSAASEASFRLPSYESPGGMFHLQSDLDISASEMEDNVNVPAQLERVSKEHLYAAYRKTNEKYNKYRGRYTDLARHYRNLERENVKAKAVLVETQDKALRRISELREQCQLEQSAKAHLENELRIELDERSLKIESLNTKIKLLQSYSSNSAIIENLNSAEDSKNKSSDGAPENIVNLEQHELLVDVSTNENIPQLVEKDLEMENKHTIEVQNLNNKIQKLEQLLTKCKETIKTHKEKNLQLTSEIQIVSSGLEKMNIENEKLHNTVKDLENISVELAESKKKVTKLEEQINSFEYKKASQISELETELKNYKNEVTSLHNDIGMFKKREEENAISLAENKLSIHKELEMKENEIKNLKESINKMEITLKTKEGSILELQQQFHNFEKEKSSLNIRINELNSLKSECEGLKRKMDELKNQNRDFENKYATLMENLKCTELQLKQESDEKLALIDRNNFLENRNRQLAEDSTSNSKRIGELEKELFSINQNKESPNTFKGDLDAIVEKYENMKNDYEELFINNNILKEEFHNECAKLLQTKQILEACEKEKSEFNLYIININEDLRKSQLEQEKLNDIKSKLDTELNQLKVDSALKLDEYTLKIDLLEKKILEASQAYNVEEGKIEERVEYEANLKKEELLADLKQELKRKISECRRLENMNEELKGMQNNNDEIENTKIKIKELESENSMLILKYQEITDENTAIKAEVENINLLNAKLQLSINSLEEKKKDRMDKADAMIGEIENLQSDLTSLEKSHALLTTEKENIEKMIFEVENMKSEMEEKHKLDLLNNDTEIRALKDSLDSMKSDNADLSNEKNDLLKKILELEQEKNVYEKRLKEFSENDEVWQLKLCNILDENNTLNEKCERLKQEKENFQEQVHALDQKLVEYDSLIKHLEEAKLEREFLNMRVRQLDADLKQINTEKTKLVSENNNLQKESIKETSESKNKIEQLTKEISNIQKNELNLNIEIQKYNEEKRIMEENAAHILQEKEAISSEFKLHKDKIEQYDVLVNEKHQLEEKLSTAMKQCADIELEKNSIIERAKIDYEHLNVQLMARQQELNDAFESCDNIRSENENLNVRVRVLEQIESEHSAFSEEVQILKEENTKLLSNIEGLQAHLKTVSKENSILSDQIRQIQAHGEVMIEVNKKNLETSLTGGSKNLNIEAEIIKLKEENDILGAQVKLHEDLSSKLLDLERQNSILIEEKLELEDQLKSSIDKNVVPNQDVNIQPRIEIDNLQTKIADILNEKLELENRLANTEQINHSSDSNLRMLEQKNEKLVLTNEKLERRLDEALVSLNHIRNLEENTELEYLRNILYEYLTGPTNNNMILAKVLSAVVKFDHRQTQLVLERERERQSLLGQLGLL